MKHLHWIWILLAGTLVTACNTKHEGYTLEGTIEGASENTVYLEYLNGQSAKTIDTASLAEDGTFTMQGMVEERGLHRLRIPSGAYWLVLMGNDDIALNVSAEDVTTVEYVSAPEPTKALQGHMDYITSETKSITEFQKEAQQKLMQSNDPAAAAQMQKQISDRVVQFQEEIKKRATSAEDQVIKAFLLSSLDLRQHGEFVREQIETVKAGEEPLNSLLTEIEKQLTAMERQQELMEQQQAQQDAALAPGKVAPDIIMKNPKGQDLKLSDLRGKVVLIDFWASWCKPCRMENPNLVKAYEKYNAKGFEIFSVSLDKDRGRWLKAIEKDNLTWDYHVSDLQGWQNAAAQKYGVSGIPFAVLIDGEGKIIDTNLRGGALERKLEEVL